MLAALAAAPALAARSSWIDLDEARMRLLLARGEDGTVKGGIEIALEPGWHTYWRNPGDSGVPPRFDFSGSENVAAVEVRYPAPTRLQQDGFLSLVYEDEVVLPLAIRLRDPAKPVTLRVGAMVGVCREICIPVSAKGSVSLGAGDEDPLARVVLRQAEPRLPAAPVPGSFAVERIANDGAALVIDLTLPEGSGAPELFLDGPPGVFLPQPVLAGRGERSARFTIPLDDSAAAAHIAGHDLRFVAVAGGKSVEQVVKAPEPGSGPVCAAC